MPSCLRFRSVSGPRRSGGLRGADKAALRQPPRRTPQENPDTVCDGDGDGDSDGDRDGDGDTDTDKNPSGPSA